MKYITQSEAIVRYNITQVQLSRYILKGDIKTVNIMGEIWIEYNIRLLTMLSYF